MRVRKTEVWVAAALVALVLLAVIAVGQGAYDVSATATPPAIERRLASWVIDHSVARRAPKGPNPAPATPAVLARGLAEYREHCLICHGIPGEPQTGIGAGLNPSPPDLASPDTQASSDGELFQMISAGIRRTGMPAFSRSEKAETLWTLVTFIRHLPKLTDEERRDLQERGAAGH